MELRNGYGVVLLVLICALAIEFIECRKRIPHTSFDNEGGWKSPQMNEQMVREICLHI